MKDGSKQVEYWDTNVRSFGVRISAQSKTFFVSRRVNGKMVRVKIGRFPEMNVDDARHDASAKLVEMAAGKNPNEAKKRARTEKGRTLEDMFKLKMSTPKSQKLKASTRNFYDRTYALYLSI